VILVTGALGQVGRRVSEILLQRGHTVLALDVQSEAARANLEELQGKPQPGTLLPAFVDLVDAAAVQALIAERRPTAIVHLAAIVAPVCYRMPALARRVNVEGTRNLVQAAKALAEPPLFVLASSAAVYGSRNPHRSARPVDDSTPLNPIDCYGEDKVQAERMVADSGLPHTTLRLGAVISPDAFTKLGPEYALLVRATPRDNRVHAIDARDAALAFANAAERRASVDGKALLIGGNESYALIQYELQDDVLEAMGIGRVGPLAGLPGDPADDRGWGLTDWFDTSEAQRLLGFQEHDWHQTLAWLAASQGARRKLLHALSPLLRTLMRGFLVAQRRFERRGKYADPWRLVSKAYGAHVLSAR
jgi:nucleoside-diphosphate-sugar epimerase